MYELSSLKSAQKRMDANLHMLAKVDFQIQAIREKGNLNKLTNMEKRKLELENTINKILDDSSKAITAIKNINSSQYKQILIEHFVRGKPLVHIATDLGVSERQIFRLKKRAIAEFETIVTN